MAGEDLYAVLGILPDAEDIVVTAAFRALAMRYHPDRWSGEPAEAHRRMSEINRAYAVLGDKARRAAYDKTCAQSNQGSFNAEGTAGQDEAFASALSELEDRWQIACSIYPDLKDHRARLARISTSLAFAFVTVSLETKAFTKRADIASHLEQVFLEWYFGTNPAVVDYARSLVLEGHRAAAKALNQLVEVMGSDVDPKLLIARIAERFNLKGLGDKQRLLNQTRRALHKFRASGYYDDAVALAQGHGYSVTEDGGFFKTGRVVVSAPAIEAVTFKDYAAFIDWVRVFLCTAE